MADGLVGNPTVANLLWVVEFSRSVSIEVCAHFRLEFTHVCYYRVEWVRGNLVVVEKSRLVSQRAGG